MNGLARAALTAAVCTSAIAVGDAVVLGTTGDNLIDDASARWWASTVDAVHAAAYGLLAAALVRAGGAVDAGSRFRRALRWLLTAALAVLAVAFAASAVVGTPPAVFEVPAGAAFALLFLVGAVLGLALLRVPGAAAAGALMAAPLLLLPLAVAIGAIAPRWAHPGYAEAAVYVGLALLAVPGDRRTPGRDLPARAGALPAGGGARS
ncbi:hypothetical protein [Kineococcus glutinatus]|uniref:Uncharacterized protein n=1 Tax=Kineococcus glutinatus TaxID=1070872 RepID=A0ABP9HXN0_9ACTN